MAEISLEKRQDQARQIIRFMLKQGWEDSNLVWNTYNNAIRDVLKTLDIYANKNPQHRLVFMSLKEEIKSWMPLPELPELLQNRADDS